MKVVAGWMASELPVNLVSYLSTPSSSPPSPYIIGASPPMHIKKKRDPPYQEPRVRIEARGAH